MRGNTRQNHLWLLPVAYFIGRCQVFLGNPLAVGFFVAVCLQNKRVYLTYGCLMLGLWQSVSREALFSYGVCMGLLAVVLLARGCVVLRRDPTVAALLSGGIFVLVNVTIHIINPGVTSGIRVTFFETGYDRMQLATIFLEGFLVFSAAVLYGKAIRVMEDDFAAIATENEAAISAMALMISVLYGMPQKEFYGIVIAETFGLFSILFALYVFGYGLGMAWTVLAGLVYAGTTGDMSYLIGWVTVAMICSVVQSILLGGRILFGLLFGCIYTIAGIYGFPVLLQERGIKAICAGMFLYLFLPKAIVLRVEGRVNRENVMKNSTAWGTLVMQRVQSFAAAMKRIDYTLAGNTNIGIGFSELSDMLNGFAGNMSQTVPLNKTMEAKLIEELTAKQLQVKDLLLVKSKESRFTIYMTLRAKKHRMVNAEVIRRIAEQVTGLSLGITEESRRIVGAEYTMVCFRECARFTYQTAVRRMSRYEEQVSGDNYYIGEIAAGKLLVMVADGMGNGQKASLDSSTLLEALEELLDAGFDQSMAIRIVNAYLAETNKGEHFATLDLLLLDLYTGYGSLYKQGAATTYIKRGEWMELVKSTSLPVGVIDGAVCEQCTKKFYNRDIVVLVSDGVLESIIFENKEDYLRTLLAEAETDDMDELVSGIVDDIRSMSGNRLKDDATIVACKLVKTL
ncbi:MAG: SpoIIE family protein phosphatase [Lachnospiraceae bacterium]|nr:SpoIIE family protein phosphatase [Lachnospiraceae bacterium]